MRLPVGVRALHGTRQISATRWLAASWVLAVVLGCSTPTLPLPPPQATVGSPVEGGLVEVRGIAEPQAYVHVFNQELDTGVIVTADEVGAYATLIRGNVGDTISIWQLLGDDLSQQLTVQVPPPAE